MRLGLNPDSSAFGRGDERIIDLLGRLAMNTFKRDLRTKSERARSVALSEYPAGDPCSDTILEVGAAVKRLPSASTFAPRASR